MFDPRTALLYTSAVSVPMKVGTNQFVPRRGVFSKAGHATFLADSGQAYLLSRSTLDCLSVVNVPAYDSARHLPYLLNTVHLLDITALPLERVIQVACQSCALSLLACKRHTDVSTPTITMCWLSCLSIQRTCRTGQGVSRWMGPQQVQQPNRVRFWTMFKQPPAKRVTVEDVCWLNSDGVLAATSCGQFFLVPRTPGTHRPPPLPMNIQVSTHAAKRSPFTTFVLWAAALYVMTCHNTGVSSH